jgi:NADP-dependent 3-hydroxy acid dehydrogenase YdfG
MAGVLWGLVEGVGRLEGRPDATIMVTSSPAGFDSYEYDPIYAMSKSGVFALVSSFVPWLERRAIRIVTICPQGIDTAMCPPDMYEKKVREGTFASPADMAESILSIYEGAQHGEVWGWLGNGVGTVRYERPPPVPYSESLGALAPWTPSLPQAVS